MPQTPHIERHFRCHDCAEGGCKKSSSITALFLDGSITGNHLQLSYNPKPKYRIKSQKLQIHNAFNIKDLKNMQKTQTFYMSVHRCKNMWVNCTLLVQA